MANLQTQLAPLRAVLLVLSALLAGGRYALAGSCWAAFSKEDFPYCAALGPNDTYTLHWKVINGSTIRFGLHVDNPDPDGWVGLGISEAGGMKGSDLAVVHRDEDGRYVVDDLWSTKFDTPTRDIHQDVTLLNATFIPAAPSPQASDSSGPRSSAGLLAVLQRPLTTCDPNDQDLAITPGMPQHVVWSYGRGWPSYHGPGTRGNMQLVLAPGPADTQTPMATPAPADIPAGARTVDLLMPNITIPAAPTTYMCVVHELPPVVRYHVIRYQPLVNSQLVHHMILFACTKPQHAPGVPYKCKLMEADCARFTIGWAPGMLTSIDFPPDVGLAVGKGAITQFALQVHYNNPAQLAGRTDASTGFRLTYTPRLRPFEMGVFILGQTALLLPPGKKRAVGQPSVCPPSCTSRLPGNLTLLTSGLHMHELGSTIITRHYRGGVELEPIGQRSSWDFNFQLFSPIAPSTGTLMPGDSLVTQCTYDTTTRTNVTTYGEGTDDEMCYNFIVYYPAVNTEYCGTGADNATAVCGTFQDLGTVQQVMAQAAQLTASPQHDSQLAQRVQQEIAQFWKSGTFVNATWPLGATPYRDPACPPTAASPRPAGTYTAAADGDHFKPAVQASGGP